MALQSVAAIIEDGFDTIEAAVDGFVHTVLLRNTVNGVPTTLATGRGYKASQNVLQGVPDTDISFTPGEAVWFVTGWNVRPQQGMQLVVGTTVYNINGVDNYADANAAFTLNVTAV